MVGTDNIDHDTLWDVATIHLITLRENVRLLLPDDFVPTPIR